MEANLPFWRSPRTWLLTTRMPVTFSSMDSLSASNLWNTRVKMGRTRWMM